MPLTNGVDDEVLNVDRFGRLCCPGRGCTQEIFLWKLLTHNDSRQKLKLSSPRFRRCALTCCSPGNAKGRRIALLACSVCYTVVMRFNVRFLLLLAIPYVAVVSWFWSVLDFGVPEGHPQSTHDIFLLSRVLLAVGFPTIWFVIALVGVRIVRWSRERRAKSPSSLPPQSE
jgi:hypothetical protein